MSKEDKYEILEWCPEKPGKHLLKLMPEFTDMNDAVEYLKRFGTLYYCVYKVEGRPEFLFNLPKYKKKYLIKPISRKFPAKNVKSI